MATKEEKERLSDKEIQCDFCPSKSAQGYTVETEDAFKVIAVCHPCKAKKIVEKVHGFMKWLWPKDAATLRSEIQEAKKK